MRSPSRPPCCRGKNGANVNKVADLTVEPSHRFLKLILHAITQRDPTHERTLDIKLPRLYRSTLFRSPRSCRPSLGSYCSDHHPRIPFSRPTLLRIIPVYNDHSTPDTHGLITIRCVPATTPNPYETRSSHARIQQSKTLDTMPPSERDGPSAYRDRPTSRHSTHSVHSQSGSLDLSRALIPM